MTLIEQLKNDINQALGRSGEDVVKMVEVYGGEFTAAEINKHSLSAPAILIACLGWSPLDKVKKRIATPARDVKFAFFILTKSTNRKERMLEALAISERLSGFLIEWVNTNQVSNGCVGKFDNPHAENLYGRAADSGGTALWLVTSGIEVSYCTLISPAVSHGSVKSFMATLIAPTVTIESSALTENQVPSTEPSAQSASISDGMNLNHNDIGATDGH